MEEIRWYPLKTRGLWANYFCTLLHECLERVGVDTTDVCYEGRMCGTVDFVNTFLKLTVPKDPKVPEFKGVVVHSFETSVLEAHQSSTRRALRLVHTQLRQCLEGTSYSYLPMAVFDLK